MIGATPIAGPEPLRLDDVGALNVLFSDAFTERYRRDGLVGVRVPPLNPMVWRYAIEGAGAGAMCWRDATGALAAFNLAHVSGGEGWMGPLAVRDDCQGAGQGKDVVRAGIAHLSGRGCRTIGLETMPRTVDNIGFYSRLGFVPGYLTTTLTLDASSAERPGELLTLHTPASRDDAIAACAALCATLQADLDFTREIRLTHDLALGDTVIVRRGEAVVAFAVCHAAPLVEGRGRDELRVLKLVAADEPAFTELLARLASVARRSATVRVAIRMQGEYDGAFTAAVRAGARVRWTDLRMTLASHPQPVPAVGILLSNWEI